MNPNSTRTPREVEYHYVLTMKLDNGSLVSADGNVLVPPDGDRAGILNYARQVIRKDTGMDGIVTFFTCGPSKLREGCAHG
ncbi:hypothetical protein ACTWJ8_13390 [Streptomyces sp. SDT5-1]|uniref:hypothetical protein n=1 Tax=Streptomyces sp. SDT5-1 TaxID=3406418 RepID=UPI003FCF596E